MHASKAFQKRPRCTCCIGTVRFQAYEQVAVVTLPSGYSGWDARVCCTQVFIRVVCMQGFDLDLVEAVSSAVSIPVIASSGAGEPGHFSDVFSSTGASAALAAGIFHRKEVSILSLIHI